MMSRCAAAPLLTAQNTVSGHAGSGLTFIHVGPRHRIAGDDGARPHRRRGCSRPARGLSPATAMRSAMLNATHDSCARRITSSTRLARDAADSASCATRACRHARRRNCGPTSNMLIPVRRRCATPAVPGGSQLWLARCMASLLSGVVNARADLACHRQITGVNTYQSRRCRRWVHLAGRMRAPGRRSPDRAAAKVPETYAGADAVNHLEDRLAAADPLRGAPGCDGRPRPRGDTAQRPHRAAALSTRIISALRRPGRLSDCQKGPGPTSYTSWLLPAKSLSPNKTSQGESRPGQSAGRTRLQVPDHQPLS